MKIIEFKLKELTARNHLRLKKDKNEVWVCIEIVEMDKSFE